jgi:hypothetical protein
VTGHLHRGPASVWVVQKGAKWLGLSWSDLRQWGSGSCGGALAIYKLGSGKRAQRGRHRPYSLNEDTCQWHREMAQLSRVPQNRAARPAPSMRVGESAKVGRVTQGVVRVGEMLVVHNQRYQGLIFALIGRRNSVAIHRRSELDAFGEGSFSAPNHNGREIN